MAKTSSRPVRTTGPRKGARRMADIPPSVLRELNAGRAETRGLPEWLAVDHPRLLRTVLSDLGFPAAARSAARQARRVCHLGIVQRMRTAGAILFEIIREERAGQRLASALAHHASDVVRCQMAFVHEADEGLSLSQRLDRARMFAADPHPGVRECAWMSVRPALALELEDGLRLLRPWVREAEANLRRFAVELTRPRGVWCAHLRALREDPEPSRPLLEPLRADPSRYVQDAVANWLNDASKTRPEWVERLCSDWLRAGGASTPRIVRRALRTLRPKTQQRQSARG